MTWWACHGVDKVPIVFALWWLAALWHEGSTLSLQLPSLLGVRLWWPPPLAALSAPGGPSLVARW